MHLLWMKTELLHPIDKGGRIRSYQLLRRLRKRHRITYVYLDDGTASAEERRRAAEYCDELVSVPFTRPSKSPVAIVARVVRHWLDALPFGVGGYASAAMKRTVARRVARGGVDAVVCDFLACSVNVPSRVARPVILFQHNLEAQIWWRRAAHAPPLARRYLAAEARKLAAYERDACRRFDRVIVVSEEDRRLHRERYGLDGAVVVPTGVDAEWFAPRGAPVDPRRVVFVGSMDWQPNDDGARFFLGRIWPRIRRSVPGARAALVGRKPSPRLRALAAAAGVEVTGQVDDVRPHLADAAVAVVPLRIAGGARLKIFEAMAMARPVVSTSIGAEGLRLRDGEGLLLADDERAFAAAVARLLERPDEARALGATARAVALRHSWTEGARRFDEVLRSLAPHAVGAVA